MLIWNSVNWEKENGPTRSWISLVYRLQHSSNRYARPVDPVNLVDISRLLLVTTVSQLAHENKRCPPMCSRNSRPIARSFPSMEMDCFEATFSLSNNVSQPGSDLFASNKKEKRKCETVKIASKKMKCGCFNNA